MSKESDLSEDDLDDMEVIGGDEVMPVAVPKPQILSAPQGAGRGLGGGGAADEYRSSAYNERLSRARTAMTQQRQSRFGNTGMIMTNSDRPTASRINAAPIDVLTQEVEEMEMQERKLDQQQKAREQSQSRMYPPSAKSGGPSMPTPSYQTPYSSGALPPPPASLPPPSQQQQQQQAEEDVPRPSPPPAVIDTSDRKSFLSRPGPQGAMVQCYIKRCKSGLSRLFPTYEIYLKDGDQFLMAARKRKHKKSSNYAISLEKEDLGRHTQNFYGKLRSNFIGTEFTLYDKGVNPEKLTPQQLEGSQVQVRQELGTILYKQNVLGSRGPRRMKVMVPTVNEQGQRKVLRPTSKDESMLERYKSAKNDADVAILKNKQPKWNDQVGAYVLNFNGRVTRASVKNFQLCNMARDPDTVLMQFGRVGKDAFTMDYQWPLCALQAFGIALSSFDYKIACE